jgi:hypothetical protein
VNKEDDEVCGKYLPYIKNNIPVETKAQASGKLNIFPEQRRYEHNNP